MYYFMIEATPLPTNQEAEGSGGAYVNCWINFPLEDGAELLARHYIEDSGWQAGETCERSWVAREYFTDIPQTLEYIEEAEQYGVCLVFHHWPADAEDANVANDGE